MLITFFLLTAICPSGFEQAKNLLICYKVITNMAVPFDSAEPICQSLHSHAHLADVTTTEEKDYLEIMAKRLHCKLIKKND